MPPTLPSTTSKTPTSTIASTLISRAHSPTTATRLLSEKILTRPLYLLPTLDSSGTNTAAAAADARSARYHARVVKSRASRKRRPKPAPLSAKEKRALGVYDIPPEERRWEIYEPLTKMWVRYVWEILGLLSSDSGEGKGGGGVRRGKGGLGPGWSGMQMAANRLSSADFHGAEVEVVRSRCVSRVGLRGIVVKDSKFVFELITRGDKLKTVPKEGTVFRIEVPVPGAEDENNVEGGSVVEATGQGGNKDDETKEKKNLVFELHGQQFQYRATERANKKFKPHFLPDL